MKNKISKLDLIKSWSIWMNFSHSCYSFERLQGLAFSHSMIPIIKKLYKTDDEILEEAKKHTEFFNTEPNIGTPIHGYIISLEEKKSNGEDISNISVIKKGLMGSMAGMGDSITQTVFTPIMLMVAILAAFENSIVNVIISTLILSIIILYYSYTGWMAGYYEGQDAILKRITKIKNNRLIKIFPILFSVLFAAALFKLLEINVDISYIKISLSKLKYYMFILVAVYYILIKKGIQEKYLIYTVYIVPIIMYFILN